MRWRMSVALAILGGLLIPCSAAQTLAEIARQKQMAHEKELREEELMNLEMEMARALQWSTGAFFRRVNEEDFVGILPTGQVKEKAGWIATIENPEIKYSSFVATDIKPRIYFDSAVVTCLWSARGQKAGKPFSRQSRVTHVYVYSLRGWQLVSSQETVLPG